MKEQPHTPKDELSFEKAFSRLEMILQAMNEGSVTLDQSLKLYEEADKLIHYCNQRLSEAEAKVEVLLKNRTGDITLSPDEKPQTAPLALPGKAPPALGLENE